jgi:hypothetical protein
MTSRYNPIVDNSKIVITINHYDNNNDDYGLHYYCVVCGNNLTPHDGIDQIGLDELTEITEKHFNEVEHVD